MGKIRVLDAEVAELSGRAMSVAQLVAELRQCGDYQGAEASFEVETPANYTLTEKAVCVDGPAPRMQAARRDLLVSIGNWATVPSR